MINMLIRRTIQKQVNETPMWLILNATFIHLIETRLPEQIL